MFYKKYVDITNDKQMFNFLKNHFEYYTANSWNGLTSIANNVKLYNLNLTGDITNTLNVLESEDYESINYMIDEWVAKHPNFTVGFNGRSGGYLVLSNANNRSSVLPESIDECTTYEEYKRYCKDFFGSVKDNRDELVYYTKLVQDFDRLCDALRDECDYLSTIDFAKGSMEQAVDTFNERYESDLEVLGFEPLVCTEDGIVDLSDVIRLQSLTEAFLNIADREEFGYRPKFIDYTKVKLVENYELF